MAFPFFKKAKKEIKKEAKPPKKQDLKPEPAPAKKAKSQESWLVLKSPHVAEKSTDLVKKNQYVFNIWPRTNKPKVKEAVESLYGVKVVGVRIIKVPGKEIRLGKIKGFKPGYKKAVVRIKEGQKIEVLPR